MPESDVKICVREDIAHDGDKDTACVTKRILLTPGDTYTVTVHFNADYHHSSHFFYSTYTGGYFITITMKFKGIYTGSSELSWEMSNHYPPRLKVKA